MCTLISHTADNTVKNSPASGTHFLHNWSSPSPPSSHTFCMWQILHSHGIHTHILTRQMAHLITPPLRAEHRASHRATARPHHSEVGLRGAPRRLPAHHADGDISPSGATRRRDVVCRPRQREDRVSRIGCCGAAGQGARAQPCSETSARGREDILQGVQHTQRQRQVRRLWNRKYKRETLSLLLLQLTLFVVFSYRYFYCFNGHDLLLFLVSPHCSRHHI